MSFSENKSLSSLVQSKRSPSSIHSSRGFLRFRLSPSVIKRFNALIVNCHLAHQNVSFNGRIVVKKMDNDRYHFESCLEAWLFNYDLLNVCCFFFIVLRSFQIVTFVAPQKDILESCNNFFLLKINAAAFCEALIIGMNLGPRQYDIFTMADFRRVYSPYSILKRGWLQ